MRGLYTGGVLDALMDHQLSADYVIGVSAGACNGVSYVSGQRGRNRRINTQYVDDRRYVGSPIFSAPAPCSAWISFLTKSRTGWIL